LARLVNEETVGPDPSSRFAEELATLLAALQ
jgi:hypothetical protein